MSSEKLMEQKTMMAQVIEAPGRMEYKEVPLPEAGEGEILIKIRVVGITAADWELLNGTLGEDLYPIIPGYEFWGEVEAVGSEVAGFSIGERVASDVGPACAARCMYTRGGRLCNQTYSESRTGSTRLDGGLAQYAVVPARTCYHLPEELDDYTAAFVKPLSSVIRAAHNVAIRPGSSVVIMGEDISVLMHAAYARAEGIAPVIVIMNNKAHLEAALQMGADYAIHGKTEGGVAKEVRRITGGRGADYVIGVCPPAEAAAWEASVRAPEGSQALSGDFCLAVSPEDDNTEIHPKDREKAVALLTYQRVNPKPMCSLAVPLKDADNAIREAFETENINKVFVVPGLRENFVFPAARTPVGATIEPKEE